MHIRNGRVIDPATGVDEIATLSIVDGRIAGLQPADHEVDPSVETIDATGCIVSPGFVDLHTHLRFPGFPEKETMQTGTAAAAAGGFTTVCAMANTQPTVDRVEVLREVYAEVARSAVVHVHQLGAVSIGLRGEVLTDMAALVAEGAVAFSDDGKPVWNEPLMQRALVEAARLQRPISVHEEDPAVVRGGVANDGDPARKLGLAPWPCAGEASLVARDVGLALVTGGHLHIAHVSCAETVTVLQAARDRGISVTAEVTPHHLRLTDRLLEGDPLLALAPGHPCTKVNPPLRTQADVDAMIDALASGLICAIATDHAPHSAQDKEGPFAEAAFGFSSIETALPLALDLVRARHIDISTLIQRLTCGPATTFGLAAGSLAVGAVADVCIFDPDERWTLRPDTLTSKGKNSPLIGAGLRGRVKYTIVSGTVVHGTP